MEEDEILICLTQMNVTTSKNKKYDQINYIFEKFIEYFTGKNFDEISFPRLSGVECFLYPELHEESVRVIISHRILQKIFFSTGLKNFSLSDHFSSDLKKFQKIISSSINLARFRKGVLNHFRAFSRKTNFLLFLNKRLNLNLLRRLIENFLLERIFVNFIKISHKKKPSQISFDFNNFSIKIFTRVKKKFKSYFKFKKKNSEFLERKLIFFFLRFFGLIHQNSKNYPKIQDKSFKLLPISVCSSKILTLCTLIYNFDFIWADFWGVFRKFYFSISDFIIFIEMSQIYYTSFVNFSENFKFKIITYSINFKSYQLIKQFECKGTRNIKTLKKKTQKNMKKFFFILRYFSQFTNYISALKFNINLIPYGFLQNNIC